MNISVRARKLHRAGNVYWLRWSLLHRTDDGAVLHSVPHRVYY